MAKGYARPDMDHAWTKIVATIGPASEDKIPELMAAGMSVGRINFSHGTVDDHRRRVRLLRQAAADRNVPVGILADIRGPKLRLGRLPGGERDLAEDEVVRLSEGAVGEADGVIPLDVPGLVEFVKPGERVFLADGVAELVIEDVAGDGVTARVVRAGPIADRKGVHLPDSALKFTVPTEQDRTDLELAGELGVDMIGVSFVSRSEELETVRSLAPDALLVAKIERALALNNLDALLAAADGIMVARGDLGVEIDLARVPMVQKTILQAALKAGKFTITATEMLESMIHSSRPTRAEVTDVANAVLDGTDALMLSGETAVGAHPVGAVRAMTRIARAVEASQRYHALPRVGFRVSEPTVSNAIAMSAADSATALGLNTIVCFTETGNTPRQLSRYRPLADVIALSPHARTLSHMSVLSHVRPIAMQHRASIEEMLGAACQELLERGLVVIDERVAFVAGVPPGGRADHQPPQAAPDRRSGGLRVKARWLCEGRSRD